MRDECHMEGACLQGLHAEPVDLFLLFYPDDGGSIQLTGHSNDRGQPSKGH